MQAGEPGGPALAISHPSIAVQAYDVASATIAAGASNIDVNIQPSSTPGPWRWKLWPFVWSTTVIR